MKDINYFKYQSRVHFNFKEAMIVITNKEYNIDLNKTKKQTEHIDNKQTIKQHAVDIKMFKKTQFIGSM